MSTRFILPVSVLAVALLAGCAMSQGRVSDAQASRRQTGIIAGVIHLPEGVDASDACRQLSIEAKHAGAPVGSSQVRESRGRCSYELTHLPADVDVTLSVSVPVCRGGNTASVAPYGEAIRLKSEETRTKDFKTTCTS
jgi:hypothetical protein